MAVLRKYIYIKTFEDLIFLFLYKCISFIYIFCIGVQNRKCQIILYSHTLILTLIWQYNLFYIYFGTIFTSLLCKFKKLITFVKTLN